MNRKWKEGGLERFQDKLEDNKLGLEPVEEPVTEGETKAGSLATKPSNPESQNDVSLGGGSEQRIMPDVSHLDKDKFLERTEHNF